MNITIRTPILNNMETSDANIEEDESDRIVVYRRNVRCVAQGAMTCIACVGFMFILYILNRYP